MHFRKDDAITPIAIEHSIDEVWNGEQLEQFYNFINYHFERDGAYLRARAYLDDIRKVVVYGPFKGRESISGIQAPETSADVEAYLARRFSKVERR